ncbi:heavy-metal-associated domain-containing protein [Enterococcus faecalis]|nr:heavy-metal-associated domain-containing protein [Enterococcus faecalis]
MSLSETLQQNHLATKKAVLESQTEIDTETLNAALAETNYSVLSV